MIHWFHFRLNTYVLTVDELLFCLEDAARWRISNNLTDEKVFPNFLDYIYVDGVLLVKPESVKYYQLKAAI